jgi:hypothetical protein
MAGLFHQAGWKARTRRPERLLPLPHVPGAKVLRISEATPKKLIACGHKLRVRSAVNLRFARTREWRCTPLSPA